jgi:dTDP-4-amino-4,6-dideoxygalactose transaminase
MDLPAPILLSPPHVGALERERLLAAFDSNWIAPVGPELDAFEVELAAVAGVGHAVAVSSGTAALHLALCGLGVGPGDVVVVPTLTFVATANAVLYVGATPVFVDCDPTTWTIDPQLVNETLARTGRGTVKALMTVDLYGQCADYDQLGASATAFGVPLVEDSAEALGGTYRGRPAGSFGKAGIFSFNGNKVITTGGGGMLVTDERWLAQRVRYLASQARDAVPQYEHREVGYNYRLSNLLAAIGRAQLTGLDGKVSARRRINAQYRQALTDEAGLSFMPLAPYGEAACWLTCLLVDPVEFGATRDDVMSNLARLGIESRPTWKPMHLQAAFTGCEVVGGAVSEHIFRTGLCLPSGSSLSSAQLERVVEGVRCTPRTTRRGRRSAHVAGVAE